MHRSLQAIAIRPAAQPRRCKQAAKPDATITNACQTVQTGTIMHSVRGSAIGFSP